MSTLEEKIQSKISALQTQLKSTQLGTTLEHFKTRVTARWASRRLWVTVLPILAGVYFFRGQVHDLLTTVVPAALTLLKVYLITTCATDAVNALCDTWNRAVLANVILKDPNLTSDQLAAIDGAPAAPAPAKT